MEFDIYSVILIILVSPIANLFWKWIAGLVALSGHPVAQAGAAGLAAGA